MLHSGFRYLGVIIRDHYVAAGQTLASVDPRIYRRGLYLPANTGLASDYLADLTFAAELARGSRREMMLRTIEAVAAHVPGVDSVGVNAIAAGIIDVPTTTWRRKSISARSSSSTGKVLYGWLLAKR